MVIKAAETKINGTTARFFKKARVSNSKPLLKDFRALELVYKIIYQKNYIPVDIKRVYYFSLIYLIFIFKSIKVPIGSQNKELKT